MLAEHLREAVSINIERKRIYSKLTNEKSKPLSNKLIFFEKLLILPAMFFDWRAKRFIKKGIPIMKNDFVPMDKLPKPETPPKYQNSLPKNTFSKLTADIKEFNKLIKKEIKQLNFKNILQEGKSLLLKIETIEEENQCHLSMIKHVTESLNLIVYNGIKYAEMSKGKTTGITKIMINGHLTLLKPCLKMIDLPAQKLHKSSCGIIVNDMPEISLPE